MEKYVKISEGNQCGAIKWNVTLLPFPTIKRTMTNLYVEWLIFRI